MSTDVVLTKRDQSKADAKKFLSLPSIIKTTTDTYLNNSTSRMRERDSSSPIHLTDETKSNISEYGGERMIRQRSSKNSSVFGATDVQLPALRSRDADNNASHQFSLACKRAAHLMMCISLYIILFSSSGVSVHLLRGDKQLNIHESQPVIHKNTRKKRRSKHMSTSPKQIPVPNFEFESSSADDSGDDSADDAPDNGGGAESSIIAGDRVGGNLLDQILEDGNGGAKKKLRPTMAYAKSVHSSQMQGAPKPKHGQDPAMYSYRDIINDANVSKLQEHTYAQAKSLLTIQMDDLLRTSDQNDIPHSNDEHSKNYDSYKNAVIIYGDTTNQVILCLAWFFLVVFMMDVGLREMKRRYRLQQLRRYMNY